VTYRALGGIYIERSANSFVIAEGDAPCKIRSEIPKASVVAPAGVWRQQVVLIKRSEYQHVMSGREAGHHNLCIQIVRSVRIVGVIRGVAQMVGYDFNVIVVGDLGARVLIE